MHDIAAHEATGSNLAAAAVAPELGEEPFERPPHVVIGGAGADPQRIDSIIDGLKSVYDPEIPVDIWELGLIYRIEVDEGGHVDIDMTLTAPNCPVAEDLPVKVRTMVEASPGVASCTVSMVWEPFWRPDMMSEVARLQLDMF